ncbi:MAG TPA: sigma-54 dependent transcriptional regulator [Steroidobacteraceae bacterium]|nr:sigma-54 dependent transcriptional regulator [Steroidobacteraceae bacterium]
MAKPLVLIVDDEPDLCELLSITLGRMGLESHSVHDVAGAKAAVRDARYDLCLTDMQLPDGNGLDLVDWLQTHHPDLPVAVITAHGNVETAVRALKLGAFDFVSKPLDLADLRKLVAQAIKLAGRDPSVETGVIVAPRLLGQSAAIEELRELIGRVARSQAPVHISGESGTGKELVAQLIHESGPRRDGPFVPVNCGAIPTELMESELFGHKRGSFTGAVADKKGMVQVAEGGTLFLDEVADLPLHMQVKLLRLIQERTVRPVGEPREVAVDVRILSATHKDLAALVAEGRFREDLYYRINVIEIKVPPLRARLEDVPDLARSILHRLARRSKVAPPDIAPDAMRVLVGYHYPGNVRELENILERALTLCADGRITAADIAVRPGPGPAVPTPVELSDGALDAQVEHIEREAIVKALEQTRYNKTAAAKLLGITFRALRYRIKKLGIE